MLQFLNGLPVLFTISRDFHSQAEVREMGSPSGPGQRHAAVPQNLYCFLSESSSFGSVRHGRSGQHQGASAAWFPKVLPQSFPFSPPSLLLHPLYPDLKVEKGHFATLLEARAVKGRLQDWAYAVCHLADLPHDPDILLLTQVHLHQLWFHLHPATVTAPPCSRGEEFIREKVVVYIDSRIKEKMLHQVRSCLRDECDKLSFPPGHHNICYLTSEYISDTASIFLPLGLLIVSVGVVIHHPQHTCHHSCCPHPFLFLFSGQLLGTKP